MSLCASAQLGFGPEAGIGKSNMRFVPDNAFNLASTKSIVAGRIGAMIDAPFNRHIYFQSGLFYSFKGHRRLYSFYQSDSLYDTEERSLRLGYLDLPLSIVFKTNEQGKSRFFLGVGGTFSYQVSGTSVFHAQGKYNDTAYVVDATTGTDGLLRKFDLAATFFAGYELPTGLFIKAYYISGVKDLGMTTEISKNRMWGIGAGYIFGKGRNINKDADDLIDKSTD